MPQNQELIDYLQNLATRNLDHAFDILGEKIEKIPEAKEVRRLFLLQFGNLNHAKQQKDLGLMTDEAFGVALAKSRSAFISLSKELGDLPDLGFKAPEEKSQNPRNQTIDKMREESLIRNIKRAQELLEGWEEYADLNDEPNRKLKAKKEIKLIQEKLEAYKAELDELQSQNALSQQAIEENKSLKNELKRINDKLDKLSDDNDSLKNQIEDLGKGILNALDAQTQQIVSPLLEKIDSQSDLALIQNINQQFDELTGREINEIDASISETLQELKQQNADVQKQLEALKPESYSVKGKAQIGLPFIFSIEAEYDLQEGVKKLRNKLTKIFGKKS